MQTAVDGVHRYSVASLRRANGQEAASALSPAVVAVADSVAPGSPFDLRAELLPHGVALSWSGLATRDGEPVAYRLYRSDEPEIVSTDGLAPLLNHIAGEAALDAAPTAAEPAYAVIAVDAAGNESPPSNTAYLNVDLLPVASMAIRVEDDGWPRLTWSYPAGAALGVNLFVDGSKTNDAPLTDFAYTDGGFSGGRRTYGLVALDTTGHASLTRTLTLPDCRVDLGSDEVVRRGEMSRLDFAVDNRSAEEFSDARVRVFLDGLEHVSQPVVLAASGMTPVPVVVPGYPELPATADLTYSLELTPHAGETVEIVRHGTVPVADGLLPLAVLDEPFLRGGEGRFRFTLENAGEAPIELVTAHAHGTLPSPDIAFRLLDGDGNVLATATCRQHLGADVVTLPDGFSVARIEPGATWVSAEVAVPVPESAPDAATLAVEVANVHYGLGAPGAVQLPGPATRKPISLGETSYWGEVTAALPAVSAGDVPVTITGRAVDRHTEQALPGTPLTLAVRSSRFEQTCEVITGADGTFATDFTPWPGEAGRYRICAVHPDLGARPVQAEFIVSRLLAEPAQVQVALPRNYARSFDVEVTAAEGTAAEEIRLAYRAVDQPAGVLPPGIHVDTGAPVAAIAAGQTVRLPCQIWADNTAPATARLTLRVLSESASEWDTVTVDALFSDAAPALWSTPPHLETGVAAGGAVSETVTLENQGMADLLDAVLELAGDAGSPPAWFALGTPAELGVLPVGGKQPVTLHFRPPTGTPDGLYSAALRVTSANSPETEVPLFVWVTQSGVGNALFKLSDIFTATVDPTTGEPIQGLAGARVYVQNDRVPTIERTLVSDTAGEVFFADLPVGSYRGRVTADRHQQTNVRFRVRPGVTTVNDVFLDYGAVTVEWSVVETTIQDRYRVVLKATYETSVPAPVVVAEPTRFELPDMVPGDVYQTEFTLTNHGLVRADDVAFRLPDGGGSHRYELLRALPASIGARERVSLPVRVTRLGEFAPSGRQASRGSGGDGGCITISFSFVCTNGHQGSGSLSVCFGGAVPAGSPGGGILSLGGGPPGGTGSTPSFTSLGAPGIVCLPTALRVDLSDSLKLAALEAFQSALCGVDAYRGEYTDTMTDLVTGTADTTFTMGRSYVRGQWTWDHMRYNLVPERSADGETVALLSDGYRFERAPFAGSTGAVYANGGVIVRTIADGFLLETPHGRQRRYDSEGRMVEVVDQGTVVARLLYDAGQPSGPTALADAAGVAHVFFDYDAGGRLVMVCGAAGEEVTYEYDDGLLARVRGTPAGDVTYQYDDQRRLARTLWPDGGVTAVSYDANGRVAELKGADGRDFRYAYDYDKGHDEFYCRTECIDADSVREIWFDDAGNAKRILLDGVLVRRFLRDGRNLIVEDDRGNRTRIDYDVWGNLTRVAHPDGTADSWQYRQPDNRLSRVATRSGAVTSVDYNDAGHPTRIVESVDTPEERVTEIEYDPAGRPERVTGHTPGGDPVSLSAHYHDNGFVAALTAPEGQRFRFDDYDAKGNFHTLLDSHDNAWSFAFDDSGRLTRAEDPLGGARILEYGLAVQPAAVADASGYRLEFDYNEYGDLAAMRMPGGIEQRFAYDARRLPRRGTENGRATGDVVYDNAGRPLTMIDAAGNQVRFEYSPPDGSRAPASQPSKVHYPTFTRNVDYDAMGRLVRQSVELDGRQSLARTYEYDSAGRIRCMTDENGDLTEWEADSLGRCTLVRQPDGATVRLEYDARSNVVAFNDPDGHRTRYEYDRGNHPIRQILPGGEVRQAAYDTGGFLAEIRFATGERTEFDVDAMGRCVQRRHFAAGDPGAPPERTVDFVYDALGRMLAWNDGEFSATIGYDAYGNKVSETVDYGDFSLGYTCTFAPDGRILSFTSADGAVHEFEYGGGGHGHLAAMTVPGEGRVTVADYLWNRPTRLVLPGGAVRTVEFDGLMRPVRVRTEDPAGNPVVDVRYAYGATGDIEEIREIHRTLTCAYDDVGQLRGVADDAGAPPAAYEYDARGHRVSGPNGRPATFDANGRILSRGDDLFEHDAEGKMISWARDGQALRFVYDAAQRLVRGDDGEAQVVARYGYDPFGRRLWKETDGTRIFYCYSDQGLLAEAAADGTVRRTYGFLLSPNWSGQPLFVREDGQYYWCHNDRLGAPRALTAGDGRIVWAADYDVFGGATVTLAEIENNLRLPGQYHDAETGLHWNWLRHYSPELEPVRKAYLNRE